ncbi:hypothetical protein HOV93_11930 [Planctomycetes bacterium FF15]|uniref:Uncharacterized protein n=1 Tax=Bremerella alba TaxID=980252 RepID=A0A7V8V3K4_9BACT|nr:hypothetical protein [Bremerella alba]
MAAQVLLTASDLEINVVPCFGLGTDFQSFLVKLQCLGIFVVVIRFLATLVGCAGKSEVNFSDFLFTIE